MGLKIIGVVETEVKEIMKMNLRVKAAVRLEDGRSKWFDVNVGVHQNSLSALTLPFHSISDGFS